MQNFVLALLSFRIKLADLIRGYFLVPFTITAKKWQTAVKLQILKNKLFSHKMSELSGAGNG